MSERSQDGEEMEKYLSKLLGSRPAGQSNRESGPRGKVSANSGGRDSIREIKHQELVSGSRALVQSIKKKEWQDSEFRTLVQCLTKRYILGQDASYRRALVPTFRSLYASQTETVLQGMSHEILSHLTSISTDSHLLVDGSQLISQLLDFDVGREVIQHNLEEISEWNKQFLMISQTQASQCFDVLFGFRNLVILSTKFACKATEISLEMEEIAVSCIKRLCYPPETNILIALAVATSVASREASSQDKRERAISILKRVSEQPHLEYACICLSGAFLSCLDHQSLTFGASNSGSLMELLFLQSLAILERTTSTACRNQAFQVLGSWMAQSSQALVGEYQHLASFAAEIALQRLDSLLILVWTYWDDTSDSVGVAVSEMFNALLKFYNSATDALRFTKLLEKLTRDAMSFDWHRKIRYAILANLIPHQDCSTLLATHPALIKELLVAYKSCALATRATDCLSQLFIRYSPDDVWLAPLGYSLSSSDPLVRRNASTFLLPKLALIEPQLMLRLVAWLQSPAAKGRLCQHGSIAATKAAVASGVIPETDFLERMWPCLFHADLAVRIDMLGLVSACQKTTAAVTQAELDAVRQALPLSANCASPEFRQKFHGHLLKLLSRLRASQAVLLRIQKPSSEAKESIARQREFLAWIEGAALASLYPGASYQRVSSALKLLEALSRMPNWTIHPDTFSQLAHVLTSPYDSCRLLASSLMLGLPTSICPDTLIGWALASLISPRAKECASGAATLDYIFQVFVIQQGRYISLGKAPQHTLPPVPAFAQELLMLLEEALDAAASSLSNASFSSPTHGLFLALQLILTTLEGEPPHVAQHLSFWKDFVQQCLAVTFRMFSIGQKALLSSSPDDAFLSLSEEEPNNALESVLSFCWRGVKEAAATQEVLLTRLPVSLAPLKDAEEAGAALQSLMVDLRHRGAFSALMPCFRAICSRLLRSTSSAVVGNWLECGLAKLAKADASITQRSAGLPLCMVAILNVLPSPDHLLLASTTRELFWLAKFGKLPPRDVSFKEFDFGEPCEDSVLPRVHGLNVLRAVFQDSGIGPQVFDGFGPLGLVVAATGLGSASWTVRNSSVLLFSTLLIRVFGIKRVRDEHDPRNSLTLREFFARFSALEPFLLQSLGAGGRAQHVPPPGLFPTLTLLARLHPTLEDNPKCHASLVAGVKSCASSPICKVRELAANATASLTHPLQTVPTLKGLIAELSTATSPNKTHGLLLMTLELVRTMSDFDGMTEVALEFSAHLDSILSNSRTCTYRRGVVYHIWAALASSNSLLLARLKDMGFHEKLPLIDLYQSSRWLDDPDYEIREKALELLPQALLNMSRPAAEELHSKVITLVLHPDPHLGTLIQAINCLAQQLPPFPPKLLSQQTTLADVANSLYILATTHFSIGVQAACMPLLAATFAQAVSFTSLGPVISNFTRLLLTMSQPIADVSLREATSSALFHLAAWLKHPPNLPGSSSTVTHIFQALVNLLQDDDEDIRVQVATALHVVELFDENLSPEKSLELLFQTFAESVSPDQSIPPLLEFMKPATSLDNLLHSAMESQNRDLFEVEKPNYYIEPLTTCQLASLSLATLMTVPSQIELIESLVHPSVEKACTELKILSNWLLDTSVPDQIKLGGPLGIFGCEPVFTNVYQNLMLLRLWQRLPIDSSEASEITSRFISLAEDQSLPIHSLLLSLAKPVSALATLKPTGAELGLAEGFLTSFM